MGVQYLLSLTYRCILLCNVCVISPQNIEVETDFYFDAVKLFYPPQNRCHLFFCTNKCECLLLKIHLYIFRNPFTQWNGGFAVVFFLFCCQWTVVTVTIRGSPQSQAGPWGAHWACFVLVLTLCVGVGDYSKHFLLSLLLIACILKKKNKQWRHFG